MNSTLTAYLDKNYPIAKQDLFATFMQMMIERTQDKGRCAFITMESWMFLSSFEKLRHYIIDNYYISSLGHFGWHIIGIAFGTAMTVIEKNKDYGRIGEYSYLTIDDIDKSKNVPFVFPKKDNGRFAHVSQQNFEKIPGCPIGYWVSEKIANIFFYNTSIASFLDTRIGLITGDNEHYIRNWYEVSAENIEYNGSLNKKWYPQSKGGEYRKWYGNNYSIIDWSNDGHELQTRLHDSGTRILAHNFNLDKKFLPAITWTKISSGNISFRRQPAGFLFNDASVNAFAQNESDLLYILGFLNTNLTKEFLRILNPTLNILPGSVSSLPLKETEIKMINKVVSQNISISKSDWDAHETSWDFQENELVRLSKEVQHSCCASTDNTSTCNDVNNADGARQECRASLADLVEAYKEHWTEQFLQLHANEEELNRQFIEIYGLEDELTPDVPPEEITILQQGEISIENGQIVWHNDVIVKQLISYAVGCMMGRYSLDCKGLILANQGDGQKEYEALVPSSRFAIDDDGIIPLMSVNNELIDHITFRFKTWLSIAFGEENFMDNLNFVERTLDKRLEDYFLKDFWKDHKKMYQNRPIYWLFSSKKGAFQCIVYMHRMNAYTAEKVRTQYLLSHIEWLITRQAEMQANAANLSARERKELDAIGKQIDECREYHDHLHVVADRQIAFDLDDGVLVNYAKFGDVLAKLK